MGYSPWGHRVRLKQVCMHAPLSRENCIQYLVINYNGKEYIKKKVCMCITESFYYTAKIVTTL